MALDSGKYETLNRKNGFQARLRRKGIGNVESEWK
jgi:hypothetical protein